MTVTDARRQPSRNREPASQIDPEEAGRCNRVAAMASIVSRSEWYGVLFGVYEGISQNRILLVAAGITFYLMLALFPGIAALVSIYGLFLDPKTLVDHLHVVARLAPSGAVDILREQLTRLGQQSGTALGVSFLVSLSVSLWTAASGFKAIFEGLNIAYGAAEQRSYFRVTAIALLFTVLAIGFVLLMLAAVVALPVALHFIRLPAFTSAALRIARWPILFVMVTLAFSVCYRYGPSHAAARCRWFSWGSVSAAVLWLLVSIAFSWYVASFGSYNKTYGSLGAIIGFMTWIWLSISVVLVGAELDAQIEHGTAR
jgi:membrane protein